MTARSYWYFIILKLLKSAGKLTGCIEFPHFGARYPDATCIDGYLWGLDSSEDGDEGQYLTGGGEDPCPVCRTKYYIKDVIDNEVGIGRIEAHLKYIFSRYGIEKSKNSLTIA